MFSQPVTERLSQEVPHGARLYQDLCMIWQKPCPGMHLRMVMLCGGQQHLQGPCTAAAGVVLESLSIPSCALCFQGGFGRGGCGCGCCWCVHRLWGLKASWAGSVCALAGRKMNNGRIYRDQMWGESLYCSCQWNNMKRSCQESGIHWCCILLLVLCHI